MTDTTKQLVQNSFEKVVPIADTAAELFYKKLFELDPSLRHMFRSDMKEQGRKLMNMIGLAVKGLDNLETLVPAVEHLGRSHGGYGVTDEHYATVGTALIWTLEKGLGDEFTPEVREAWVEVYTVLSTTMKNAANADRAIAA